MGKTLDLKLEVSGVPENWVEHARPEVADAYKTVRDFQERTGAAKYIEDLKPKTASTYVHLRRLGMATTKWAVGRNMDTREIIEIASSVEIHDIGKILMPGLIEFKGIYTPQHRKYVSAHPAVGAALYARDSVECPEDKAIKSQVLAQTLGHHKSHDDPQLLNSFRLVHGTAIDPRQLHILVRTVDMFDASSNLGNRPYGVKKLERGMLPFLRQDNEGQLTYDMPKLIDDICGMQKLSPETRVFGDTLGTLIEEFAVLLPPVAPIDTSGLSD